MEDAAFTRDRLHEAGAKLAEWVEALEALEADRRSWAEHERVLDERDRLAAEMGAWPTRLRRSLIPSGGSIFVIARLGGSTRQRSLAIFARCCRGQRPLSRPCFRTLWSGTRSWRSRGCRHASCILWGRRERQAPRQAISGFASGGLNLGRSRAEASPRLILLDDSLSPRAARAVAFDGELERVNRTGRSQPGPISSSPPRRCVVLFSTPSPLLAH
jgi:hypothetical protein